MPSLKDNHNSSRTEGILRYSVLGLLIWLPIPLGSNLDWASSLFVLLTAILAAIRALTAKPSVSNTAIRTHRAALPLLLLLISAQCWVAAQWLSGISVDGATTFRNLLLGAAYCLLFWLIISLFQHRNQLTTLLITLILSGTFQAFYGSFMTLSGIEWLVVEPKEFYRGVVTGTFINRNHLAGYLEMTLACGIGLMLAMRGRGAVNWRNLTSALLSTTTRVRLALAIMVIALVMSHSRMGNTAFFSSLLLIGALFIIANKEHRLRNSLILVSLIVIDLLILSEYFGLEKLKERILNTQLEDKIVAGEVIREENVDRDDVAGYVAQMIKEKPLTGYGAGTFQTAYQQYAGAGIVLDFDHAHNDFLQFIAEYGLIGVLPLALFVLLAFYHALRAMWNSQSLYRSGLGAGAAMGILALMIHSGTDFNLQIPASAATFICLCAIAVQARHHSRS